MNEEQKVELKLIHMEEVVSKEVSWLWYPYIPYGKISNGKSAITSKSKLLGVAKHNLRKYKSPEYSSDNILLLRGTEDLYQDVKNVYHQEFDEAVQQYNQKQKRADRRIEDYFEHVANLNQDMAVEIIFQCGDKEFWEEHTVSWSCCILPLQIPILIHSIRPSL